MKNKEYSVEFINPKTNTSEIMEFDEPVSLEHNYERVCSENFDENLKKKMKNRNFDEDKIIEIIVIPVMIVFALLVWWLVEASHVEPKGETTIYFGEFIGDEIQTQTAIVENSVESVENTETTTEEIFTTVKIEDAPKAKELGTFKITGYTPTCSHCCLKSDGIGSSGRKIEAGKSVAMNEQDMKKHGFKYGDKIYIVGIGERAIEDTGCKQGVIDVACDSHESCYKVTGFYKVKRVML